LCGADQSAGDGRPMHRHAWSLAVQGILDRLGWREGQLLRRGDLDRCTGRRVTTVSLRRRLHLELAKSGKRGFRVRLGRINDLAEHAPDNRLGLGLRQVLFCSDLVGDFIRGCHSMFPYGPRYISLSQRNAVRESGWGTSVLTANSPKAAKRAHSS